MAKKEWYLIQVECIKFNPSLDLKVGEKVIVAKVKSYGLAYVAAKAISGVYKDCAITIK